MQLPWKYNCVVIEGSLAKWIWKNFDKARILKERRSCSETGHLFMFFFPPKVHCCGEWVYPYSDCSFAILFFCILEYCYEFRNDKFRSCSGILFLNGFDTFSLRFFRASVKISEKCCKIFRFIKEESNVLERKKVENHVPWQPPDICKTPVEVNFPHR